MCPFFHCRTGFAQCCTSLVELPTNQVKNFRLFCHWNQASTRNARSFPFQLWAFLLHLTTTEVDRIQASNQLNRSEEERLLKCTATRKVAYRIPWPIIDDGIKRHWYWWRSCHVKWEKLRPKTKTCTIGDFCKVNAKRSGHHFPSQVNTRAPKICLSHSSHSAFVIAYDVTSAKSWLSCKPCKVLKKWFKMEFQRDLNG